MKIDELQKTFEEIGMNRPISAMLSYLVTHDGEEIEGIDIESAMRLRQPEVSSAASELSEKGFLTVKQVKKPGKGRPLNVYSLKLPLRGIVAKLEKELQEKQKKQDEIISKLGKLCEVKK